MGILQEELAEDIGSVPVCDRSGSERVGRDALACWNPETGLWELETVFQQASCQECLSETTIVWKR